MIEVSTIPADLETTVERLLELPPDQRLAISERLRESVPPRIARETLAEWRRRLQEIEDGVEAGIPADEVMTEIRQALHEARQVPS